MESLPPHMNSSERIGFPPRRDDDHGDEQQDQQQLSKRMHLVVVGTAATAGKEEEGGDDNGVSRNGENGARESGLVKTAIGPLPPPPPPPPSSTSLSSNNSSPIPFIATTPEVDDPLPSQENGDDNDDDNDDDDDEDEGDDTFGPVVVTLQAKLDHAIARCTNKDGRNGIVPDGWERTSNGFLVSRPVQSEDKLTTWRIKIQPQGFGVCVNKCLSSFVELLVDHRPTDEAKNRSLIHLHYVVLSSSSSKKPRLRRYGPLTPNIFRLDSKYGGSCDWGHVDFVKHANLAEHVDAHGTLTLRIVIRQYIPAIPSNSKERTGMVGLYNQGATCYLNSLLQTLFHTRALRNAVYELDTSHDRAGQGVGLELQRLFSELQTNHHAISTKDLTKAFGWTDSQVFTQHDVQELLRELLDKLETRMRQSTDETIGSSVVKDMFCGRTVSVIRCLNVPCKSERVEEFYDVQLDVTGMESVKDSFRKYVESERMTGENQYDAEGFGKQDAEKYVRFQSFPPVLHLHLKRFEYIVNLDRTVKINQSYKFDSVMDLGEFVDAKETDNIYMLHSVLVHSGDVHHGHYWVYVNTVDSPDDKPKWHCFNDDLVRRVSAKEAIKESFGDGVVPSPQKRSRLVEVESSSSPYNYYRNESGSSAYMLVYIRRSMWKQMMAPIEHVPTILLERFAKDVCEKEVVVASRELQNNTRWAVVATLDDIDRFDAFGLRERDENRKYDCFEDMCEWDLCTKVNLGDMRKTTASQAISLVREAIPHLKNRRVRVWLALADPAQHNYRVMHSFEEAFKTGEDLLCTARTDTVDKGAGVIWRLFAEDAGPDPDHTGHLFTWNPNVQHPSSIGFFRFFCAGTPGQFMIGRQWTRHAVLYRGSRSHQFNERHYRRDVKNFMNGIIETNELPRLEFSSPLPVGAVDHMTNVRWYDMLGFALDPKRPEYHVSVQLTPMLYLTEQQPLPPTVNVLPIVNRPLSQQQQQQQQQYDTCFATGDLVIGVFTDHMSTSHIPPVPPLKNTNHLKMYFNHLMMHCMVYLHRLHVAPESAPAQVIKLRDNVTLQTTLSEIVEMLVPRIQDESLLDKGKNIQLTRGHNHSDLSDDDENVVVSPDRAPCKHPYTSKTVMDLSTKLPKKRISNAIGMIGWAGVTHLFYEVLDITEEEARNSTVVRTLLFDHRTNQRGDGLPVIDLYAPQGHKFTPRLDSCRILTHYGNHDLATIGELRAHMARELNVSGGGSNANPVWLYLYVCGRVAHVFRPSEDDGKHLKEYNHIGHGQVLMNNDGRPLEMDPCGLTRGLAGQLGNVIVPGSVIIPVHFVTISDDLGGPPREFGVPLLMDVRPYEKLGSFWGRLMDHIRISEDQYATWRPALSFGKTDNQSASKSLCLDVCLQDTGGNHKRIRVPQNEWNSLPLWDVPEFEKARADAVAAESGYSATSLIKLFGVVTSPITATTNGGNGNGEARNYLIDVQFCVRLASVAGVAGVTGPSKTPNKGALTIRMA